MRSGWQRKGFIIRHTLLKDKLLDFYSYFKRRGFF